MNSSTKTGRLQQRVRVLGVLGQVLVEVAKEPGGQRLVRQVVHELAVVARASPEVNQRRGGVTTARQVSHKANRPGLASHADP